MANQQAAVTVTGFVAGDPTLGGTESFRVLTFRMGSTRSRLNPTTRQWEDYGTAWVGVKAFRALAVNAASSVRRGDRIIVVGSLITEQWTNEQGEPRSRTVLEATNIGHDLTFGTTSLIKPQRAGNGNGGNGGNGNGNVNGAAEGVDGGNGQRASSPYVRPTQYSVDGAASGVGIDPYATSSESGPVEFGVTSDSGQSPSPSTESAAVADAVMSQPDADTNQPQPVAQQTYVDGFAESSNPSDSEF